MKFYIASKVSHARRWKLLRDQVQPDGFIITSTWIDEAGEGETKDLSELAARCIAEIKESDFLLLYCEPDEILKGALIEAGAALAIGKPVLRVGRCDSMSRVFEKHPNWSGFTTIRDALADWVKRFPQED